MSASSFHEKMTDSLERELTDRALAQAVMQPLAIGAALRRGFAVGLTVLKATRDGIRAARPTAAQGEW